MSSKIIERRYHDLSFVIRPLPVVKVASNTRACSKLEEQLPMKGWDGVSVVSHSCVTSSKGRSSVGAYQHLAPRGERFFCGSFCSPSLQKPTPSNCNSIWNRRTLSKMFLGGPRFFLGKHISFFTSNLQVHFISVLDD